MSRYAVCFEWPPGILIKGKAEFVLNADTVEIAKIQAAMLYAGAAFEEGLPTGYRIICNGGTEVYRYPEAFFH